MTQFKDDFKDSEKREAMRISLIENLLEVAKSQHEKGNEFPLLLKMDPVRAGIKILKKIGADLKDLQNQMEKVYEMCEGCLQEKYGKKQKRLPQVWFSIKFSQTLKFFELFKMGGIS